MITAGARRIAAFLAVLGFWPGAACPAQDYEGRPILEIRFAPEAQPYPRDYLLEILPLKVRQPLGRAGVRAAIERLYATGRYADIEVEAENRQGGVVVSFRTEPEFFVGRVTVEGVREPPNAGALANSTRLDLGARFDRAQLGRAVENIKAVLANNGFSPSRVEPRLEYDAKTQQVHIKFEVQSGPRARYAPPMVTGNPERPPRDLARASGWRRWPGWLGWKTVTESRTQDGLERVRRSYHKQDRLGAEVALSGMEFNPDTRRVTPTLQVEAGPRVRVEVEGAKVSKGKLRRIVPVYQEGSVDRDLLVEGARNLTEYFQGQGYFHAQVSFKPRASDGGRQVIVYDVNRGEHHKLVHLEIRGNRYFDTDTIRERIYVRPASFPQFRHGRYSDQALEQDREAITALYRANGFREAEVAARAEHGYRGKLAQMAVFIDIREGPQWRVARLELEGVSAANQDAVRSMLQSGEGQPFSEANVAIDRENILDHYNNSGYPEAAFEWSSQPAGEPHQVNVKLTIREGGKKFVRDVLIGGLTTTDPELVRERLRLGPGEPLSRSALLDTQRRLYDLQIFAKVDATVQNPTGQERDKYVLLQMDESRRYSLAWGFGAEVGQIGGSEISFESPAGEAGFSPRVSFDVSRSNLWGNAHTLSFRSRVSTLQKRGLVSYEAPQFRGSPNLSLLLSAMYEDSRDVRTFSAVRQQGAIQMGYKLSKADTLLGRFTYRRVTVDPDTIKIDPQLIPLYSQPARLGILAGNFIRDRRDDPTNSRRGIYTTVDLAWASHAFGSQADFTRLLVHNATYHSMGFGNRFVLARALSFGWLQTLGKPGSVIPLPERFFAGGADSHRGFPQNQAGPRDLQTGFPLGGRALLNHRLELRFPLLGENVGGVLFHDAGNLYSGLNKLSLRPRQRGLADFDYMVHAAGFGIRYRTPIGPLRLDFAYSFNPPAFLGFKGTREELLLKKGRFTEQRISHFQFHFSLGQSF
ncbi:MAG: POTRA domain-containing protein [Acidobacteriota bacterium]